MMKIKRLIDEDFSHYRKPSMLVAMPTCTFKCGIENCQNAELISGGSIWMLSEMILDAYAENSITSAVVFAGLEPLDSWDELCPFIHSFRKRFPEDMIVIYTGYTEDEAYPMLKDLGDMKNVIVKYGRYTPGHDKHYDEMLGVELASDNQYAKIWKVVV